MLNAAVIGLGWWGKQLIETAQAYGAPVADGRVAVMTIRKIDFDETRAAVPDTENLINIPLQIRSVEVVVLFVEPPGDGPIRVSFRSKGQIDVAKFAEAFGGGGHSRAAGAKLPTSLPSAQNQVTEALLRLL